MYLNFREKANVKLISLQNELRDFLENIKSEEISQKMTDLGPQYKIFVQAWCFSWFSRIKQTTETIINAILPEFQSTLVDTPEYFKEILTIEAYCYFLDHFFEQITPFVKDEINIYRGVLSERVEDTFEVNLEFECAEYNVYFDITFNYTTLCKECDIDTQMKVCIKIHANKILKGDNGYNF